DHHPDRWHRRGGRRHGRDRRAVRRRRPGRRARPGPPGVDAGRGGRAGGPGPLPGLRAGRGVRPALPGCGTVRAVTAYRALGESAWSWVLTTIQDADGPWLPASVPGWVDTNRGSLSAG